MSTSRSAPLILPSNHPFAEADAPRTDFALLSQALGCASLFLPPSGGNGLVSKLEKSTASDLRQAITAARRQRSVSVYVSLSEKIGLPLSLLLAARRIHRPHVLVAHHLTSQKKRALQSCVHWLQRFTRIVVLSEPQAAYLREEAGYPEERIAVLPDSVDTDFWRSHDEPKPATQMILSVGQERRDYRTLFAAAQEFPSVSFVVVPGSAWAARHPVCENLPPNVTVQHDLSYSELRMLYRRASLVVVPLEGSISYAAGANALLEAMSMGKAIVQTETPGLRGYVRQGENGHVIPAANPLVLADSLRDLQSATGDAGVSARKPAALLK